jgi:hypothetical protein
MVKKKIMSAPQKNTKNKFGKKLGCSLLTLKDKKTSKNSIITKNSVNSIINTRPSNDAQNPHTVKANNNTIK